MFTILVKDDVRIFVLSEFNVFPMQTFFKNVSSSTDSSFFSSPPPLYHLNAQLAFKMWCLENVVELPVFTGAEVPPECSARDAAQRTGTRGTNVPALCLGQPGVRSASVTFRIPPTSTQVLWNLPLLSLLTSENFWPFTEPCQGSALPLGHGSVCIDEVIFPGYWKTQAGWFIKETPTS